MQTLKTICLHWLEYAGIHFESLLKKLLTCESTGYMAENSADGIGVWEGAILHCLTVNFYSF